MLLVAYLLAVTQKKRYEGEDFYAMSRDYRNKSVRHKGHREAERKVRPPRLTVVKSIPLRQLVRGTVVWAHIMFQDGTGEKARPAVIVEVVGREITLLPITTSPRRQAFPERYVELGDVEQAGIMRASAVELRTVRIDRIDLVNIIGELSDRDRDRVLGASSDAGSQFGEWSAHAA